jgi:hypothetical protein
MWLKISLLVGLYGIQEVWFNDEAIVFVEYVPVILHVPVPGSLLRSSDDRYK